jgi:hypothetical protein
MERRRAEDVSHVVIRKYSVRTNSVVATLFTIALVALFILARRAAHEPGIPLGQRTHEDLPCRLAFDHGHRRATIDWSSSAKHKIELDRDDHWYWLTETHAGKEAPFLGGPDGLLVEAEHGIERAQHTRVRTDAADLDHTFDQNRPLQPCTHGVGRVPRLRDVDRTRPGDAVAFSIDSAAGSASCAGTQSLDPVYGLDDAAVSALHQWRFKAGTKDGKAVAIRVHIEMRFNLK